jgi:2-polyprenyl-3-methyl-5-hydroxy-6-metoxy-1,4-benzoquinol methylase
MGPSQKDVRSHYEAFPFPSGGTPHLTLHWTQLISDFFKQRQLELKGKTFLDAGCGTGDNVLSFAEEFSGLQFTGVDLSTRSIQIALSTLQKRRIQNLAFYNEAIMEHQPKQQYDFLSCLGVLHHCQDPEKNLRHLMGLLKPKGYLFLDVYGYFGYLLTERTQKVINLLQPDFSNGVNRKEAMAWIASEFLGLTVPTDTTHPRYIGLADGLLVPIAHSYRIAEIIQQLTKYGLSEITWWDSPKIEEGKIHYKSFRGEIFEKTLPKIWEEKLLSLPQLTRYEFFELCFAPFDYFLVGQTQG